MSPRRNWYPTPSAPRPLASVPPPPGTKGRGVGEGVGCPNSDDWRKSLALCLLCVKGDCVTFTNLAMTVLRLNGLGDIRKSLLS